MHPTPPDRPAPLEEIARRVRPAPSPRGGEPWAVVVRDGALEVRAGSGDGWPGAPAPPPRRAVIDAGAAVLDLRVALAGAGRGAAVRWFPRPGDPALVAAVRPAAGPADPELAARSSLLDRSRSARPLPGRPLPGRPVPDDVLDRLAGLAADGDVGLVPVRREQHRELVTRPTGADLTGQVLLMLTTATDDRRAWARCGEVLERLRLVLADLGWTASPLPGVLDVPLTRTQLRSALSWAAHPQALLRIGAPAGVPSAGRRADVGGRPVPAAG
ncbi:hypothetical protein [Geodermatophilus marinus]|uniref:hypothetical protein n=1 Tax=Geodermatophilus sp. LHW52908 TaxID=2303986 RepID=UPI000E3D54F2|nr:hypothetical protein [Geodermatophilus sp. LHW52908]RFU20443.1 hypothetical protein D0Z06_16345 [Geodermatophilus sp. LHW52908]